MTLEKEDITPDNPDEVKVIEQPSEDVTDEVGEGAEEGPVGDPEQ